MNDNSGQEAQFAQTRDGCSSGEQDKSEEESKAIKKRKVRVKKQAKKDADEAFLDALLAGIKTCSQEVSQGQPSQVVAQAQRSVSSKNKTKGLLYKTEAFLLDDHEQQTTLEDMLSPESMFP